MPWYQVKIILRSRKVLTGARKIDIPDPDKLREYIWGKARDSLGRANIDYIDYFEIPADHPLARLHIQEEYLRKMAGKRKGDQ